MTFKFNGVLLLDIRLLFLLLNFSNMATSTPFTISLHIQSPYYIFKFPKKYYTDLEYFAASIDTIRIF